MNKIAIVSMAGTFPGARDTGQFLQNILDKKSSVTTVPPQRWVAPADVMVTSVHRPDRAVSDKAGLITNFKFDPSGFRMDKDFLASLDPVHHLVLAAGRRAFESCHITKELERRTGVILAAIALPTDTASMVSWEILCASSPRSFFPADAARSAMVSAPAAILARAMGFYGGSFTLDAACASSLYAVKLACEHLSLKKADIMVAGGVSRPDSLYTQVGFTQLKALSPTGCCAPFDKDANGLVVGEGVGILVLKRLEDAIACGDTIHGVIAGSGASNDLEGNLVGPASEGQVRAMKAAFDQAGWTPARIQYMECHGSGTPVGDQVEAFSIRHLLDLYDCPDKVLAIGSIKSMIGHLLTAAGAAGLIKTVLAMEKGCLPPSLNFTALPDKSPLHHSRVKVQTKTESWQPEQSGIPRRAGISAFGFGGINAHILVEEFSKQSSPHFVPEKIDQTNLGLSSFKSVACAIVGMETISKNAQNLENFKGLIFGKNQPKTSLPGSRWRRTRHLESEITKTQTAFMEEVCVALGEFHIPPNQIQDILPQHLLMLKAAKGALEDAGISHRPLKTEPDRIKTGCAIGIDFDFGATDFFLRWKHHNLDKRLLDKISRELTFNRTLGALGGIVASRIAREFKLGGPCFTLSAQAASGIKAIETAVHSLSLHETDTFLCGCVDLAGDIRQFTLNQAAGGPIGTLPSEGACALVLKRLDQAVRDKDRIYGIISGISGSGGARIPGEPETPDTIGNPDKSGGNRYRDSLSLALKDADTRFSDLSLIDTHSLGVGYWGEAEALGLKQMAADQDKAALPVHLSCAASGLGDTGGGTSLFSVIKAALSLYHRILPGSVLPQASKFNGLYGFVILETCQFWQTPQKKPRKAAVGSMTLDGACAHAILEEHVPAKDISKAFSFFDQGAQLFVFRAASPPGLVRAIGRLKEQIQTATSVYQLAHDLQKKTKTDLPYGLSIVCTSLKTLDKFCTQAIHCVDTASLKTFDREEGIFYTPTPLGSGANLTFVYPGAGSQYLDMGRSLALLFPDIAAQQPVNPQISAPPEEKELAPMKEFISQVGFGMFTTQIARAFNIIPTAALGHSLGETAMLFALKIFDDPQEMLRRINAASLFTTELGPPYARARKAWNIAPNAPCLWQAVAVNKKKEWIHSRIKGFDRLYILIQNTDNEIVLGGEKEQLEKFLTQENILAQPIAPVLSVHCDLVKSMEKAYYDLHCFPCTPPENMDIYGSFAALPYVPDTQSAARSLTDQALFGFDFSKLIRNAHDRGSRIFLEMGPGASCTRMIGQILQDRPHQALSICPDGKTDEKTSLLKALGTLAGHGLPMDIAGLFTLASPHDKPAKKLKTSLPLCVRTSRPPVTSDMVKAIHAVAPEKKKGEKKENKTDPPLSCPGASLLPGPELLAETGRTIARAHEKFLDFSSQNMAQMEQQFQALVRAAKTGTKDLSTGFAPDLHPPPVFLDRDKCLEYAIGKAGNVLGPAFDIIDTYPVRVRLPAEPLMLVDRIMDIQGEMLSLSRGKIITQHDVKKDAWYLDGGKVPVSISIEAGQADLFLCAYLGIDHAVKGKRKYRLLDAKVTFHRTLPEPDETIEYHIEIDRFLKQGDIYLFFFHYKGYIDNRLFISMEDGCAGFFTEQEVKNSGGIILKKEERLPKATTPPFASLVPVKKEAFSAEKIHALRKGDLETAFGPEFNGICLGKNQWLPGGRMTLIDRVTQLDPRGGRFGLGQIWAEADIHPDDWFLTCHFIDDMVMPGTLMYECCAHTLRVFVQRMGWVSEDASVHYDVIPFNTSDLKCRGPVTRETKKATYKIEIKEIGYTPEPYVIADAVMFSDDLQIVLYKDMGMKLSGITRDDLYTFWRKR
ncbi:MAG: hypothetical protein KKF12_02750 [Proteobacteria bacterium]|nr:hypothetical protein [Pseudomonadota bacterium]